jgi:hypothetical protein
MALSQFFNDPAKVDVGRDAQDRGLYQSRHLYALDIKSIDDALPGVTGPVDEMLTSHILPSSMRECAAFFDGLDEGIEGIDPG